MSFLRSRRLALVGLLPLAAACGDGTAPRPVPIAPTLSLEQVLLDSAIARARSLTDQPQLRTATGFLSGRRLSLFTDFEGMPFPGALRASVQAGVEAGGTGPVGQLTPPPSSGPLIPDSLKGRTYVERLMVSSNSRMPLDTLPGGQPAPGAPADGVRIVLRAGEFGSDTARVGWATIREPSRGLLHVEIATLDGTTIARAEGPGRPMATGVIAQGWVRRDTRTLTHRRTLTSTSTLLTLDDTWEADFPGLEARALTRIRSGRAGEERHLLTLGGRTYGLRVTDVARGTFELGVLVDDSLFATRTFDFTSSYAGPGSWKAARGGELTDAERDALDGLVRLALALYDAEAVLTRASFWLGSLRGDLLFPFAR